MLDQIPQGGIHDAPQLGQQDVGAFVFPELGHRGPPGFLNAFAQLSKDFGGHGWLRCFRRRG